MNRRTLPAVFVAAFMLLAGGWVLGLVIDPAWLLGLPRTSAEADAGHEDHDDAHEGHVHLSEAAFNNLKLRMGRVRLYDGKHYVRVPGEVVEKPGRSDYALAAPLSPPPPSWWAFCSA